MVRLIRSLTKQSCRVLNLAVWSLVLGPLCMAADVDYQRDIKPLLKTKCFSCHGPLKQEAGLRLDSIQLMQQGGDSGAAITLHDVAASLMVQRVTMNGEGRMPPEAEPLTVKQLQLLRDWIAAGAPAPQDDTALQDPSQHWAFQPLQQQPSLSAHSIDQFVDRKLAEHQLSRNPPATRSALLRRLYLDLTGLPPTAEEVSAFVNDESPDAYLRAVDRILASPRYGERWAQHWLDVVRYADTHGFEVNTPRPNAWPYRDYVIQSLNSDKPYNQFVFDQIAGDTVGQDAATGFLVAAPVLLPGQIGADDVSKRQARQDALADIISGTTSVLLGLSVGCARCHDHKFDPISQRDYYAYQAFFAGVEYDDRPMSDAGFEERKQQSTILQEEADRLRSTLTAHEPIASTLRMMIIDDEDEQATTSLKTKNGHGDNGEGKKLGDRDDVGTADRMANIGKGRYTWWNNVPGEDVFTYDPTAAGRFRIWLSWGVHGSGVHTRDARYVIDLDGDLATKQDQTEIAKIDQYYFANIDHGTSEQRPMWSGLFDAGVHDLGPSSRIVLRGGQTETGITADVIVLEEVPRDASPGSKPAKPFPRLRAPLNYARNVERFQPIVAQAVRFTSLATVDNNRHEPCLDELEVFSAESLSKNIALAALGSTASSSGNYSDVGMHQLPHIHDGVFGNNYSWISNELGQGWVQIRFAEPTRIDTVCWGRDREGKFQDRLPVRYRIEVETNPGQWQLVASSEDRAPLGSPHDAIQALVRNSDVDTEQLRSLADRIANLDRQAAELRQPTLVFAGKFRTPDVTFVLNRGDSEQPTDRIGPQLSSVLNGGDMLALDIEAEESQRRSELARALIAQRNPLVARVMVNRIWQHHFGIGLVETSNDFGMNGTPPSHPELLDWLAGELIRSDWSIKHIQRLILLSETYQQSSAIRDDAFQVDADSRLLWRFPARRVEAEAVRDCMLWVTGQLNLVAGGPGFDFFKSRGGLDGFPPITSFGPEGYRRMIYSHKVRMEPVPVFGAFDCPDAGQSIARRTMSTTAIQALNLFNSEFSVQASQAFAQQVRRHAGDAIQPQVESAFVLALGRSPTSEELAESMRLVESYDLPLLCRVLLNSNEFLFLP